MCMQTLYLDNIAVTKMLCVLPSVYRCGMVSEAVVSEHPIVSEWLQTLHFNHSHIQQLLSMLTSQTT